jgi:hypothetical protein
MLLGVSVKTLRRTYWHLRSGAQRSSSQLRFLSAIAIKISKKAMRRIP